MNTVFRIKVLCSLIAAPKSVAHREMFSTLSQTSIFRKDFNNAKLTKFAAIYSRWAGRDCTLHFITKEQCTCTKIKQWKLFPDVSGGQSDGALSRRNSHKILASIRCFPPSMCIIRRAPASWALRATRLPLTLSTCVQFKCTAQIVLDSFVYIFIWATLMAASVRWKLCILSFLW